MQVHLLFLYSDRKGSHFIHYIEWCCGGGSGVHAVIRTDNFADCRYVYVKGVSGLGVLQWVGAALVTLLKMH